MATEANKMCGNASSLPNGCNKEQALPAIDDRTKTGRHPRWTRQETLVLIQGKKVVESRIREGHRGTSATGLDKNEPKWDSVSSYCKQHGVNREPVQCRKRWSNLLVDFKKIKTWESQITERVESFWIMRNDLKKKMKLPGFFDREVYEVLEGGTFAVPATPLTLVTTVTHAKNGKGDGILAPAEQEQEDEEEEEEAIFDSGRHLPTVDGFLSNFEPSDHKQIEGSHGKETGGECLNKTFATPLRLHISEKQYQPFCRENPQQDKDTLKDSSPGSSPSTGSTSQERGKRRRLSLHVSDTNMGDRLIQILERNSSMLNAQLEAHSIHCRLDREQRKQISDSLIAAVNKLTDATQRIIDKL